MKIAYISMRLPSPSETFAAVEIRTLRKMGHEVDVWNLRPPHRRHPHLLREQNLEGIPVDCGSAARWGKAILQMGSDPPALRFLLRMVFRHTRSRQRIYSLMLLPRALQIFHQIRKANPDIVHLFWGHYPSLVGILVGKFLPNVRLSMFLGAYDLGERYPLSVPCSRWAHAIFTQTEANRREIVEFGVEPHKIRVIPRGIDISGTPAAAAAAHKQPIVVTAGRLTREKGMDRVLQSFARIAAEVPEARLHIAGDGPDRKRLGDLSRSLRIHEKTTFHGFLSPAELFQLYQKAAVFMLLSTQPYERHPNAVKEAMYNECACIVSDTPGIRELVPDDSHGFVIQAEDLERAAALAKRLLSDPKLRGEVGHNARQWVESRFGSEKQILAYLAAWRKEAR